MPTGHRVTCYVRSAEIVRAGDPATRSVRRRMPYSMLSRTLLRTTEKCAREMSQMVNSWSTRRIPLLLA